MNKASYNSIVSDTEVNALKDMIFKRVKDRAGVVADNANMSYMDSAKTDVMEAARASFAKNDNPFMNIKSDIGFFTQKSHEVIKSVEKEEVVTNEVKKVTPNENTQNHIDNFKFKKTTEIANNARAEAMDSVREELSKKSSFMGALNFLNSQATIALIKKRDNGFNALA